MSKRIWELDAFRGLCILGMVIVHFVYDLTDLYRIIDWEYPAWFSLIKDWGGVLFLLISGISATLGSRSVRRGLIVFLCGMVCTAVTYGMYRLGMAGRAIIIYFGVLHCLGCCMLLWWLFRRLPTPVIALSAAVLILWGLWLRTQVFPFTWAVPLGYLYRGFASSDYFPLILNFGFFLAGAVLGRTVYGKRTSLLPQVNSNAPVIRFLCACGRQSLWIYLLHQPILSGLTMALAAIVR